MGLKFLNSLIVIIVCWLLVYRFMASAVFKCFAFGCDAARFLGSDKLAFVQGMLMLFPRSSALINQDIAS